jgi:hypothetical protein
MKLDNNDGLFSFNSDHSDFGVARLHKGLAFRTIDGSQNNLAQPELNAAGTDFTRVGLAHFADGVSTPVSEPDVPNPREISNIVDSLLKHLLNHAGVSAAR